MIRMLSRLSLRPALLALPALFFLGACGEDEVVDPYVYGNLTAVTRGALESKDFLYEIDVPEVVFVHGNTAIVRSDSVGNHLEVLVMDDAENRLASLGGKLVGVQKFYSPYVWLMAKRVKDGLSVTDLDSVKAPILPRFTDVKLDEVNGYDISKLHARARQKDLDDMLDAEVQTVGRLVYRAEHTYVAPKVVEGVTAPAAPMGWYLISEQNDATFKVTNVNDSLEFSFRLLEAQDLPFIGGVKITDTFPRGDRRSSGVSGTVEVQYIKFANRYLAP